MASDALIPQEIALHSNCAILQYTLCLPREYLETSSSRSTASLIHVLLRLEVAVLASLANGSGSSIDTVPLPVSTLVSLVSFPRLGFSHLAHFRVSITTCGNLFEGVKRRRGRNSEIPGYTAPSRVHPVTLPQKSLRTVTQVDFFAYGVCPFDCAEYNSGKVEGHHRIVISGRQPVRDYVGEAYCEESGGGRWRNYECQP